MFWGLLQSPPYSSGSYDSVKTDAGVSAEDLSSGRAQIIDDDDDEHDEHDDSDKINDAEGMDPERLKAFNVSRRFSEAAQTRSKLRFGSRLEEK